jgi:hypothetical protein
LDLVGVDLDDELIALLFQFWAFETDNVAEQLVFQALACDGEVDDRDLDADLRQVVRVGQFRGDVETEVAIVFNITVSESN